MWEGTQDICPAPAPWRRPCVKSEMHVLILTRMAGSGLKPRLKTLSSRIGFGTKSNPCPYCGLSHPPSPPPNTPALFILELADTPPAGSLAPSERPCPHPRPLSLLLIPLGSPCQFAPLSPACLPSRRHLPWAGCPVISLPVGLVQPSHAFVVPFYR